jgi:two-component system sensor histidine kinase KdpD
LLEAARAEGRGRLKVFLGAAPGVGKTYAMLRAGHRRKAEGLDIVVGIVETHGRRETEELLSGLDILPCLSLPYRGQTLTEFNLDAALARKPKLILVDELAHSNAPGSRHPKRYQDVEELLAAGIDVYTTLNIQHIESLNDVVMQITRIRVRETLPDSVIEKADEVELVDITPEELIQRLKEGKVYVPENAQRAIRHFFQPGNITALRELALRRTAERVDDQMVAYMQRHAIEGPWPAGERILVCVSGDALGPTLVRHARRLADLMNAYWVVATVERPNESAGDDARQARLAETMRLAQQLGADAVTLSGSDLVREIMGYARSHNITQIVIGRAQIPWWRGVLRRSLVKALLRETRTVALHIVAGGEAPSPVRAALVAARPQPKLLPYGFAALAVAAAIGLGHLILPHVPPQSVSMILLVAVIVTAVLQGTAPAILAAFLSFLGFNFFFVEPLYTITVAETHELLALFVLLTAGIVTGAMAGRIRNQAEVARRRHKATQALYDFSRKLGATAKIDDLLWAIATQVAGAVNGRSVVLMPDDDDVVARAAYPPDEEIDARGRAAARWAWQKGEIAGWGSGTLPEAAWQFRPMSTARGRVGVVAFRRNDNEPTLTPETDRTLNALLDQAAVAIERASLVHEMAQAEALVETEKLRSALLSSISHDLRTPLASIIGSASSLLSEELKLNEAQRRDLLRNIQEEGERLNRFVGNLLDMTRLESGALQLRLEWADMQGIAARAIERIAQRLERRNVTRSFAPDLKPVLVDAALMEQVLFNLLDNAVKYSADGSTIALSARNELKNVVIEVSDEGAGIPADKLERVFDKFYRLERTDRQPAGTGLGLSICRGFVEAMGGRISALRRDPHAGTTFRITMPAESRTAAKVPS